MCMKRDNKLIKELKMEQKRNSEDNLKFVKLRALWLKRMSNKEWSSRQKTILDSVYKRNRHLKLNLK